MNRSNQDAMNATGVGSSAGVYSTPTTQVAGRDLTGRSVVAGLFADRTGAERAIGDLKTNGFDASQIGVAMRDRTAQGELIEDTGTQAAEGAAAGALGGGLLGGLAGLLIGIGALAIPGIGPVVAGGVLASAFGVAGGTAVAGAGIGAAAGGILGALTGMGIPAEEARHFEAGFHAGGVLVTVNAGTRAMEALAVLERNGADTGPGSVTASAVGATGYGRRDSGAPEVGGGAVAGAATGAAIGSAVGGPVGTVAGGIAGAVTGAAAGEGIHQARPARVNEAEAGGALTGGTAGAVVGTVVGGPVGTVVGGAIGGAAGATTGAATGTVEDEDRTTDESL